MSLTRMLSGKETVDIELQTILREGIPKKKDFSTFSGIEAFSSSYTMTAPYLLTNPYHSSVVGTAFDYMARFIIAQQLSGQKENVSKNLTAEAGLEIAMNACNTAISRKLEAKYEKGLTFIGNFLNQSKTDFEKLLPYAAYLARLEHVYRSGMLPQDVNKSLLGEEDTTIIKDLKQLCEVFMVEFIPQVVSKENKVVFNPHFGLASQSCGGADADIYIDGTLYDFKTSKSTGYRWKEVAQIFGYYMLKQIAVQLKDESAKLNGYEIKRLAFYRARYGEFEFIDISTMDPKKLDITTTKMVGLLRPRMRLLMNKDE